jgi:hypothetical protein
MSGRYVKMHEAAFNHELLRRDPLNRMGAYIGLLLAAKYQPDTVCVKGQMISLQRGQLVRSHRYLVEEYGWSLKKVRIFLGNLEVAGLIARKRTRSGTIITMLKYDDFEVAEHGHTSGAQENLSDSELNGVTTDASEGHARGHEYKNPKKNQRKTEEQELDRMAAGNEEKLRRYHEVSKRQDDGCLATEKSECAEVSR